MRWIGAELVPGGARFRAFAPGRWRVEVVLEERRHAMQPLEGGRFEATVLGVGPGTHYRIAADGGVPTPDPGSRFQPEGVHGPSEVVGSLAAPRPLGIDLRELSIYELHVGTFTSRGDFAGVIERLDHLAALGVNAIELMPINDFPGRWSWGYDPAALFAPARTYGRPEDLLALVDAAHARGIAVIVDVVLNHLGPDGAYAAALSPELLSKARRTPWGPAFDLDGRHADGVRRFLFEAARIWLEDYGADGLRIDSTPNLRDDREPHFLAELSELVESLPGPRRILIAEDNRNLRRLVEPRAIGGYGLDATWTDDFHHHAHRVATGERRARSADLARCIADGWVQGSRTDGLDPERFVFFLQNHDQVGNRARSDRWTSAIGALELRALTAVFLFAPQIPLLFMGQEWAARTPFWFFADHRPELAPSVTAGRRRELAKLVGADALEGTIDPQREEAFLENRLDWTELERPEHAATLALHRDLLAARRGLSREIVAESPVEGGVVLRRGGTTLVAALRPGIEIARPRGEIEWHSELDRYGEPTAIEVGERWVRFRRAGAMRFAVSLKPEP